MTTFDYSNVNDRRRGPVLTAAGLVLRGIPAVQARAVPYAEAWERDNRAALAATGPLWVALGDSLTQGLGASAHDRGWVGQLRDQLAGIGHDFRVVNLGVSGARTSDLIARQLPALAQLPAPTLVTVMIGSNDLFNPLVRRGLPGRFAEILRRLPRGAVITTLPNPTRAARQSNKVITRLARERDLVVADLRDGRTVSWRGKLAADHFHPNDRGYTALADVVFESIAPRLR